LLLAHCWLALYCHLQLQRLSLYRGSMSALVPGLISPETFCRRRDIATLTDRTRQIIATAAAASTKLATTRVEINGYTDTSGTPKYNQALSIRGAEAVAAELVKDGVPKTIIAIPGFGETHLLVQTGAGVREPPRRDYHSLTRRRPFLTLLIYDPMQTGSSGARSSTARTDYSLLAPNLTAE
jgi:hypothetical protein